MFPVEYGPDFDTALETVICDFFTRLDELLLIPDFKQVSRRTYTLQFTELLIQLRLNKSFVCLVKTAVWISDAPSVLEEYMKPESKADKLKVLLRSKAHCGKMAKMDTSGKFVCLGYQPD